jgi:hypothetical protein
LNPQLVLCSPPVPENPVGERLALIELSLDSTQPTSFRVGERRWQSANPTLGEILSAVDETKGLFRRPVSKAADTPATPKMRRVDSFHPTSWEGMFSERRLWGFSKLP